MRFQTKLLSHTCLWGAVIMIASAAQAEIRVYDPTAGESVAAPQSDALEQGQAVRQAKQVEVPKQTLRPDHVARGVLQAGSSRLGRAIIFIEVDKFTPEMAEKLHKLDEKDYRGLEYQVYVKEMDPRKYIELAAKGQQGIEGLKFRVDSGAYMAIKNNVKNYDTIVYVDSAGTRRRYDASGEFDKFLRHVKRVARGGNKR